jgi:hypothetical protein
LAAAAAAAAAAVEHETLIPHIIMVMVLQPETDAKYVFIGCDRKSRIDEITRFVELLIIVEIKKIPPLFLFLHQSSSALRWALSGSPGAPTL